MADHDNQRRKGNIVYLKENENITSALRRFKRKMEASNVLEDVRAKEYFEKPTWARKRKAGAAKARWKKKMRDQQLPPKLF